MGLRAGALGQFRGRGDSNGGASRREATALDGTHVFAIVSRGIWRRAPGRDARGACAMQWRAHGLVAGCALALALPAGARAHSPGPAAGVTAAPVAAAAAEPPAVPNVFGAAFAVSPLDTLVVTGGYGEGRSNHFHAGWDFSTGGRVGRPVRAPLAGAVERVRASGVGYGRSLYLRAADGRLLVFGHLDAFAGALAAHVDSAQRVSARYEQDLWPVPGRFRFAAGDLIAWTGESGAGPPHLHVEVRHADFAMHPLRAGLVPGRVGAPRIAALTLEPLDEASRVAGGVAPRTIVLRAAGDTLEAEGRLRAVVSASSGVPGASDAPPWSTALEWNGESVEARLDSISWAGEMSEQDFLVDRGRIGRRRGLVLWAPAGFRPRFLRTSAPLARDAGVIEVRRGDPPRALRVSAREPGGAVVERVVVLRPPRRRSPPRPRAGATRCCRARSCARTSPACPPGCRTCASARPTARRRKRRRTGTARRGWRW